MNKPGMSEQGWDPDLLCRKGSLPASRAPAFTCLLLHLREGQPEVLAVFVQTAGRFYSNTPLEKGIKDLLCDREVFLA